MLPLELAPAIPEYVFLDQGKKYFFGRAKMHLQRGRVEKDRGHGTDYRSVIKPPRKNGGREGGGGGELARDISATAAAPEEVLMFDELKKS